jgi:hypothetical protein
MKGFKALNVSLSAAIAVISLTASPLLALQDNGGGSRITKDGLKGDGYTCERAGVNFTVCEKSGHKTYWCTDSGDCTEAPLRQRPSKFQHLPSWNRLPSVMGQ